MKKSNFRSRFLAVGAAWAVAGRFRGRVWRRGVEQGSYGRGQGYGRGQEGHDGEKDGMGQEKEDGMDGKMALHGIPTIGDNQDQHGHCKHILGLEMQKELGADPCLMSLERPL